MIENNIKRAITTAYFIPLSVVILFLLTACAAGTSDDNTAERIEAWLVYWRAEDGIAELQKYGHLFDRVSFFAYELSSKGEPIFPPGVNDFLTQFSAIAQEMRFEPWVTVVNDVRGEDGEVSLKEVSIVRELLSNPISMRAHARQLVAAVRKGGFRGLHLDYEGFEAEDQEIFRYFAAELQSELTSNGLGLEIVVEPLESPLPEPNTASITVMCYNLHGPHSAPGPVSTPEFLTTLSARGLGDIEKAPTIALPVIGYAWQADGSVRTVGWSEAEQMAVEAKSKSRESVSGVPHTVSDDGSIIWFEDEISLERKWHAARASGFKSLIIWHLGGNDVRLFDLLNSISQK